MAWKDFAPIPATEITYGIDRVAEFTSGPRVVQQEKSNGEKVNVTVWDVSATVEGETVSASRIKVRLNGSLETPQLAWRARRRVARAESAVMGNTLSTFISADRTSQAADRVSATARAATAVGRRRPAAAA